MFIDYLGSKRLLIKDIMDAISHVPDVKWVADLFAGTTRVGCAMRHAGLTVLSNDINAYSYVFSKTYIESNRDKISSLASRIEAYNKFKPIKGFFYENYACKTMYFTKENAGKIDAIRAGIENDYLRHDIDEEDKFILLASLLLACKSVINTTGIQAAYLKTFKPSALRPLVLGVPGFINGPSGVASRLDANNLVKRLQYRSMDLAYIDTPYNRRDYLYYYHLWETLVKNDEPELEGKVLKRSDCIELRSLYTIKDKAEETFNDLIQSSNFTSYLVSFSSDAFIEKKNVIDILKTKGDVFVKEIPYKKYKSHELCRTLTTTEYLFLVSQHQLSEERLKESEFVKS